MDRHVKNEGVYDRLGKRVCDQNWASRDEGEKEYVGKKAKSRRSNKEPEKKKRLRNR
jgi:hypothetical protein